MKRLCIVFCLFALFVFADEPTWRMNYEKGLQLQAQGQYEDAVSYFKMAVADKPISEIESTFEYLPYLHIGICYYHLGNAKMAAEFLQAEKSFAALGQSKSGKALMTEYTAKVNSGRPSAPAEEDSSIRLYERKPYTLSDAEVAKMREDIRSQCNLPKANEESYPWYYHYELGLALSGKSDWQRALDSFLTALDHRDQPHKLSRTYGMWFLDYYPYYNIGVAHYHLQNWKCAENSFKLSQTFEEVPKNSTQYRNLQDYLLEAQHNEAEQK